MKIKFVCPKCKREEVLKGKEADEFDKRVRGKIFQRICKCGQPMSLESFEREQINEVIETEKDE